MNRIEIKEVATSTIVTSILRFAENSLNKRAKFQVLDLIIPNERKVRSIVGGMETSLGTTLWEPLGRELARRNGFTVIEEKLLCPSIMPSNLNNIIQSITDDRLSQGGQYDADSSHLEIKRVCQSFIKNPIANFRPPPRGHGVDIWLFKDGVNYFFDTKTVQPNIGTLSKCLEQLLHWYAFFYSRHPTGKAEGRIVFPYNPTPNKSFWDTVIGRGRPLTPTSEALVEDQFWDFCSGYKGTYKVIEESFLEIHESGVLTNPLNDLIYNHD